MEKTVTVDGAVRSCLLPRPALHCSLTPLQEHKLSIWDTAGQERFHALTPLYYRDADGALLVYDITDGDSFQRVRDWVKELRKVVGPSIKLAIAGNKCDMLSKRHVTQEVAEAYAKEVGASHTLTSAKTGTGLAEVFQTIAKNMAADPAKANAAQGGTGGRRGGRRGRQKLTLVDSDEEDTKPKTSCC